MDQFVMHTRNNVLERYSMVQDDVLPAISAERPSDPAADALWGRLPVNTLDRDHLARGRIITLEHTDPMSSAYDLIRTRIIQRMRRNDWRSVAVTAPTAGCGKTVTSINLAFSVARRRSMRTLLVDLDMRRPKVASYLGLPSSHPFASYLRTETDAENTFMRCAPNLAVATNNKVSESAGEVFSGAGSREAIDALISRFNIDLAIFDLPPMLANDDALSFVPNVDGVILVLEAGVTTGEQAQFCEQELAEVTNVLGVVLNKCRFAPDAKNYY